MPIVDEIKGPANESRTMRAVLHRRYGSPDVLAYEEIERPVPGDDEVLLRVYAAGASIGDYIIVTGKPYLIRLSPFGGFPQPRNPVPGACMAGRVEAVGAKSRRFEGAMRYMARLPLARLPNTWWCPPI